MVQPAHTQYVFEGYTGAAGAPLEYWSFSLKSPPDFLVDAAEMTARANQARAVWSSALQPVSRLDTHLTRVKYVQKLEGGATALTANGAFRQGEWVGDLAGANGGGATYPLQTAVCVSLATDRSGATGKGRFFLPSPHYVLGDDHRLSVANTTSLANACRDFVQALGAVAGGIEVVSSKGYATPVKRIRLGRVLDTMRSRRGNQLEEYVTSALA